MYSCTKTLEKIKNEKFWTNIENTRENNAYSRYTVNPQTPILMFQKKIHNFLSRK